MNESRNHIAGNVHAREDSDDKDENRCNQQACIVLEPFDIQLTNNTLFCNTRFTEVSLSQLKSKDAVKQQLMFKYIGLQIICIITACAKSTANTYTHKNNTMNDNVKFTGLILCQVNLVLHPDENS